jgi:hypothetical protein
MLGPGAHRPDPTEGLTALADLPPPEIVPYNRTDKRQACPRCHHPTYRDKQSRRTLHDLGNLDVWCPRDLVVTYSQHYCTQCHKYFNADLSDLAPPGSRSTHRVIDLAVRLVVEDGLPYRPASWHLWRDHRIFVPFATIQNWVEAGGGGKTQARMDTAFLDSMISGFPPHPMPWNVVTGAIARCKATSIACARKRRSVRALCWTCGVKPKLKGVNKPSKHDIMRVQDKHNPASLLQSPKAHPSEGISASLRRQT